MEFNMDANITPNMNDGSGTAERYTMPLCRRELNSDISEDLTLPDYEPEIRRVLYIRENLLPVSKFINGNKLDIEGTVDYTLVYVSGDGKLCSTPLSSEYSASLQFENSQKFEMSEGVTVIAHSIAESSSVRVVSPRKLQVRSRIKTDVSAFGKKLCCEQAEGVDNAESIQRLYGEAECADMLCENSEIITLTDTYTLPGEDTSVALADSAVCISGTHIEGEVVHVDGEVILRMLTVSYTDDGKSAEQVIKKLPFEAECSLDGVDMSTSALCRVNGTVTDVSLNIEEGNVMISADLALEVCLGQNRSFRYTKDAYSTEQTSQPEFITEQLPYVMANKNVCFSQSERVPLTELGFPEGGEITDISGTAYAEEILVENGKCVISGSCKYNIICTDGGEYVGCEVRLPFKYETDTVCDEDNGCDLDALISVLGCKVKKDGEFLSIESELGASYCIMGSREVVMLNTASFGECREKSSSWRICYIRDHESLWDIAKKYGIRQEEISGDPSADRFIIIEK